VEDDAQKLRDEQIAKIADMVMVLEGERRELREELARLKADVDRLRDQLRHR
jgi:hypothetical protein